MTPVAAVAADTAMKFVSGQVIDQLGEDGAAGVHRPLSAANGGSGNGNANSNRKRRE